MLTFKTSVYAIRPSKSDTRDWIYKRQNTSLRQEVYLTAWDSQVEDQGMLGSCAAEAITCAYELQVKYQYPDQFAELSRLFLYYNTRVLENTIAEDAGVFRMKNALISLKNQGICSEDLWPYDISKFAEQPSQAAYQDALRRKIKSYKLVPGVMEILENLNNNIPVVIGIEIFDRFLTINKSDPVVKLPSIREESLGGHAMCVLGYSLEKAQFYVKNSFGTQWGDSGYCWIPFEYLTQYAFENWIFEITDQVDEKI
jgi:C1A family cysteine protease